MTRTEKVLRIAKLLSPNAVDEHIRRTMLEAEYILEVAYTTEEDDSTTLASYHTSSNSVVEPKEVPVPKPPSSQSLSKTRSATIAAKKDWGLRRIATKPRQDRQDLVSLLKSYAMHYGFTTIEIGAQARRQNFDFSTNDINHWFRGDNLPGDYKFDQIFKFLEVNDRDRTEEKKNVANG